MTYPPPPGEHNHGYPTSGQPGGWGPPQPPPYPHQPDPTLPYPGPPAPQSGPPAQYSGPPAQYSGPPAPYDPNQPYGAVPQYGFPPPPPPRQKSKTTPIVAGIVALVLVLCVGVVTSLYLIGKNAADDEASQATEKGGRSTESTTGPSATPTSAPTSEAPEVTIRIAEPAKLGGRSKLTDSEIADIAEGMRAGLAADPGVRKSFSAFYGDIEKQNVVVVAAAEIDVPLPGPALAGMFVGLGKGGLQVPNPVAVSTGTFGGAAKCGDSKADGGVDVAVCGWADEGSIGMVMWYFKKAKQVKAEFPKLRAQIETRS
ncbi:hypothetical protein [Actinoplanes sp. CA-252034]|uniref:hypothetical protein n=1 Tax=Actinoplanes sp. CA-252034 TaxID=3239906 RepID=UPI003D976E78